MWFHPMHLMLRLLLQTGITQPILPSKYHALSTALAMLLHVMMARVFVGKATMVIIANMVFVIQNVPLDMVPVKYPTKESPLIVCVLRPGLVLVVMILKSRLRAQVISSLPTIHLVDSFEYWRVLLSPSPVLFTSMILHLFLVPYYFVFHLVVYQVMHKSYTLIKMIMIGLKNTPKLLPSTPRTAQILHLVCSFGALCPSLRLVNCWQILCHNTQACHQVRFHHWHHMVDWHSTNIAVQHLAHKTTVPIQHMAIMNNLLILDKQLSHP
mmetsp:Transcript_9488/g.14319  ORF Transcript_9488/g.14319 Transcript_9488/m.14319 type:complete len:268 (+) Transcript_9488:356-1159(+)